MQASFVAVIIIIIVLIWATRRTPEDCVYLAAVAPDGTATTIAVRIGTGDGSGAKATEHLQASIAAGELPPGISRGDELKCAKTGRVATVL